MTAENTTGNGGRGASFDFVKNLRKSLVKTVTQTK